MKLISTYELRPKLAECTPEQLAKEYKILVAEMKNFIYSHAHKNGVYPVDNVRNKFSRFPRPILAAYKSAYLKGIRDTDKMHLERDVKIKTAVDRLQKQLNRAVKQTGLSADELKKYLK